MVWTDLVYEIDCKNCDLTYIGQKQYLHNDVPKIKIKPKTACVTFSLAQHLLEGLHFEYRALASFRKKHLNYRKRMIFEKSHIKKVLIHLLIGVTNKAYQNIFDKFRSELKPPCCFHMNITKGASRFDPYVMFVGRVLIYIILFLFDRSDMPAGLINSF